MPVDRRDYEFSKRTGLALLLQAHHARTKPLESQGPAFVFANAIHLSWGNERVHTGEWHATFDREGNQLRHGWILQH
jgi:hypothetical protein